MGNVTLGRLSMLGGFRVERTETEGEGALQVVTPEGKARRAAWVGTVTEAELRRRNIEEYGRRQTRTGDYQNVPGVHFKYEFSRNLRTTANYDTQTVSSSNPNLQPQTAHNFDLAMEYYFEPAGLFTAGVFLKEIKKFIYTTGGAIIGPGQDNGVSGEYAGYSYTTQYNGGFATVKGIELSYSQQFTFLPGIWKGLGAYANLTRMQAEGNYGTGSAIALVPNSRVAGFNPFIANVGVSYIRSHLSLRASLNYRGRYLTGFNANESRATYAHARPSVDIKTLYNLNKYFSIYLDVVNVFMEPDRQMEFGFGRPQTTHLMRPQFFFGANARM